MEEVWKRVEEFGGECWISNLGRMRRDGYGLKCFRVDNRGYAYFRVKDCGKRYRPSVHRLVAKYFIDNPFGKEQVNHKDGNKLNNCVENLEWCTDEENQKHAYENNLCAKPPISVLQYSESGEFIREWESVRKAKLAGFGCSSSILDCCRNKRKSCGGYVWRFKNANQK